MAESDLRNPPARPASPEPLRSARALRRAALGALAAEVGHELQGPLNLFRMTQERLGRGDALDAEDLSLLEEELERLSRLSARLRALARSSLELRLASPLEIVQAALATAPPLTLDSEELELDLEPESPVAITCDLALIACAVRELIDNALDARTRHAGVRFQRGQELGLCVWDDGPGLELELPQAMSWGVTTRPTAAGIGLTLVLRAARAHGFGFELRRGQAQTEAWLLIPARALGDATTARRR
jgi:signal transduction histidine kinase